MSNKGCFQGNWGDFLMADPQKLFQNVDVSVTSGTDHEMSG